MCPPVRVRTRVAEEGYGGKIKRENVVMGMVEGKDGRREGMMAEKEVAEMIIGLCCPAANYVN